jgi:hypothetical protein
MDSKYFLLEGMFKDELSDARKEAKKLVQKLSREKLGEMEDKLLKDVKSKGYDVQSLKMSLGKFRGNYFITSAKLAVKVKADKDANDLLKHLQDTYSEKFKLKSVDGAIAHFNVR